MSAAEEERKGERVREGEGGGVGIPIPRKSKRSTHVCRLTITNTELKVTSTWPITYSGIHKDQQFPRLLGIVWGTCVNKMNIVHVCMHS